MKKILIFDNYDSFTYNLVHALEKIAGYSVHIYRNDQIALEKVNLYDKIVLSPGPGLPNESGILMPLSKEYAMRKSIFGVCLGNEAIGEVYGGKLHQLNKVYHGVASTMKVVKDDYIFKGLPSEFKGGRYHSWVVSSDGLPDCLEITVSDEEGKIMGLRHKIFDLRGVQFHPESVLTPEGEKILKNWLMK